MSIQKNAAVVHDLWNGRCSCFKSRIIKVMWTF